MTRPAYMLTCGGLPAVSELERAEFASAQPFKHAVLEGFLPWEFAAVLDRHFPDSSSPVWLNWRNRSGHQYAKQGPGDASRFDLVDAEFEIALQQFNSHRFLSYLESLTGIARLLPDPYFQGGGMHQILRDGLLDIHTDFNVSQKLGLVRRLNVLVYLNRDWRPEFGGELELWDGPAPEGKCCVSIEPMYNRCVVFCTDKTSFHGHPNPWTPPDDRTRRSIALYYYTADREAGKAYDEITDFQGVAFRDPSA